MLQERPVSWRPIAAWRCSFALRAVLSGMASQRSLNPAWRCPCPRCLSVRRFALLQRHHRAVWIPRL